MHVFFEAHCAERLSYLSWATGQLRSFHSRASQSGRKMACWELRLHEKKGKGGGGVRAGRRLSLSPRKLPGMCALLQNRGLSSSGKFGLLEDLKIQCGSPCHPVLESCFCRLPPTHGRQAQSFVSPPAPAGSGPSSTPGLILVLAECLLRAASPGQEAAPPGIP